MKQHTTNYFNTLVDIADDCPAIVSEIPPIKEGKETLANLQYNMLVDAPYQHTSDDVFFTVFAIKNKIAKANIKTAREEFFSKGQPCFRASPLTKRYGWAVHSNADGKVAFIDRGSKEYATLSKKEKVVKGMKSSK
jgi:hypothetical protein